MEEYKELQEMREQLALLKAQVAKQSLVNEVNVRHMAKDRVSRLKGKVFMNIAICIFGLFCWLFLDSTLLLSRAFLMVTVLFFIVAMILEIYTHLDLWNDNINSNMADYSRRMVRIKKLNAQKFKWGMIFIFPWFAWFVWELYKGSPYPHQWIIMAIGGIIGGIIGFAIGYNIYLKEQRYLQEMVDQIDGLIAE